MVSSEVNFKITIILPIFLMVYMSVCAKNLLAHDEEYRGILYWGHEVRDFSPCDSEKVYAVSGSSWVLGPLYDDMVNKKSSPYQTVYIIFRGHLLDEILDGFASKLDGLIRISKIRSYTFTIPSECDS